MSAYVISLPNARAFQTVIDRGFINNPEWPGNTSLYGYPTAVEVVDNRISRFYSQAGGQYSVEEWLEAVNIIEQENNRGIEMNGT